MPAEKKWAVIGEKLPDGRIRETRIELPCKSGLEGLALIDELEKRCGGPVQDPARDRRWLEMMAKRKGRQ